jgi:hypothetical protein
MFLVNKGFSRLKLTGLWLEVLLPIIINPGVIGALSLTLSVDFPPPSMDLYPPRALLS